MLGYSLSSGFRLGPWHFSISRLAWDRFYKTVSANQNLRVKSDSVKFKDVIIGFFTYKYLKTMIIVHNTHNKFTNVFFWGGGGIRAKRSFVKSIPGCRTPRGRLASCGSGSWTSSRRGS
jgi:hypothetical protein